MTSSFHLHNIIFIEIYVMFLFQLISVLWISITFYTYLANIIFLCNLVLNANQIHSEMHPVYGNKCFTMQ